MYFMILLFLFIDLFYQYFLFVILKVYRTVSQYGMLHLSWLRQSR